MKQISSVRLIAAAAASLALSFPAFLSAQIAPPQLTRQPPPAAVLAADLSLPDAPQPQAAQAPQTPQADSPAASQSHSDPATPAASSTPASDQPQPDAPASPQPPVPSAAETRQQQHEQAERDLQREEKQRLLGIMPQFQVVMGGTAVPLTAGEKWRLALHSAIDPFYIGWAFVIGGGYGELSDSTSQQGYGWGPAGYFKRVGSNYADNVNGALIGNALLPSVLHQDPRYFRKGTGSVKSRFVYAALSTVICHGDNGKNQFNTSNVLGNFISGAISNAYYPASQRGLGLTLENGIDVTLFGALGGQLLEFGPDISRHLHRKAKAAPPIPSPAAVP